MSEYVHKPVLASEVLSYLMPGPQASLLLDATVGQGGHSLLFLNSNPLLHVIGVDADPRMLSYARERLAPHRDRCELVHAWFDEFLVRYDRPRRPDRILMDLGISMVHLRPEEGAGFSYRDTGAFDMRLNPEEERTAMDALGTLSESELADIIYGYGEERLSRRIARALKERRHEIESAADAAEVIRAAVPPSYRRGRIHPATRTFQALRIWVNRELERLERAIPRAVELLAPGGIIGVISFHSLEDRIVKQQFKKLSSSLPDAPTSYDEKDYPVELVTKKPVRPSDGELSDNPASRSAKLRVARKVAPEGESR
ncbi:MAG: 16S rRNA (cytosine(1402)-N(4))-methyltransferase RsmH [Alkalispirochaetaceae bacterium]